MGTSWRPCPAEDGFDEVEAGYFSGDRLRAPNVEDWNIGMDEIVTFAEQRLA